MPQSICMVNLKQLGLGSLMYSGDNNDRWPNPAYWMDQIRPYIKTEEILRDSEGVPPGGYGYAFRNNASISEAQSFNAAAQFALIFDSTLLGRNAHSELWSLPQEGRHKAWDGFVKDNVVFADGHGHSFSTQLGSSVGGQLSQLQAMQAENDQMLRSMPAKKH